MKLSREEVIHIAALARMGLSEAEIEKAREQLANILENFEVLKEKAPTKPYFIAYSVSDQDETAVAASREWPPRAKKLSWRLMGRSLCSSSPHSPARACSNSPCGASNTLAA